MPDLITVHGDAELMVHTAHLFAGARTEFSCAARDLDTWSQPAARAAIGRQAGELPPMRVRKLLSPLALASEASREHLREIAAHGAGVRIAGTPLPRETIVLDRRFMILAGADAPRGRQFTVTTSETLVSGMLSLYDAAWESATALDTFLVSERPQLTAAGRDILHELAAGRTDETAARRLGLSVRTYRRRVAELMQSLDADSRFQAGVRAGALGLTG